MPEQTNIGRQRVAKAGNDLLDADNNLSGEDVPFDTVCFHCQQPAERLLKAYPAARGWTAPVTHDLLLIVERIVSYDSSVETLRDDLTLLTPYAVELPSPDDRTADSCCRDELNRRSADGSRASP